MSNKQANLLRRAKGLPNEPEKKFNQAQRQTESPKNKQTH